MIVGCDSMGNLKYAMIVGIYLLASGCGTFERGSIGPNRKYNALEVEVVGQDDLEYVAPGVSTQRVKIVEGRMETERSEEIELRRNLRRDKRISRINEFINK